MVTLGQRLTTARRYADFTQAEAAERAEIGVPYISKIERDLEIPSEPLLVRLAKIYKVSADELVLASGRVPDRYLAEFVREPEAAVDFLNTWQSY